MTRFDPAESISRLAGFQRATVDHVFERFYGETAPVRRFLVADETGLGKSMVARGVVARTIDHLQDDASVGRIDVVYVCSNAEIARQNVTRLDVIGHQHDVATRLTLLASGLRTLQGDPVAAGKGVNLVSFTPGTLPGGSWATGTIDERALIHVMLSSALGLDDRDDHASMLLFQDWVQKVSTVRSKADATREAGVETSIAAAFLDRCERRRLVDEYLDCLSSTRGKRKHLPAEVAVAAPSLIAAFRSELARASVEALEPDLIILDEFQRFRQLLDPESGGEAASLAHDLFEYPAAKVLLLSATPIKAYTFAEEALEGDNHESDLRKLLQFLCAGSVVDPDEIVDSLADYRQRAVNGLPVELARGQVRTRFLRVMCRTERPRVGEAGLLEEVDGAIEPPPPDDFVAWAGLHRLAKAVDAPVGLDYWKSAPYFANFLDGYRLGERVRARITDETAAGLEGVLSGVQTLDRRAVEGREEIDLGSARMRALAARTIERGLHLLLWVPPSLPYHGLGGPYRDVDPTTCSKELIFSAWAATPTAVASLLSYEADRRCAPPATAVTRLDYRVDGGRAAAMTTLALFWPNPGLADLCDPLLLANPGFGDPEPVEQVRARAAQVVAERLGMDGRSTSLASTAEAAYWQVALGSFGPLPAGLEDAGELTAALAGAADDGDGADHQVRLHLHVESALAAPGVTVTQAPPDLASTVAELGLHAPGNVAWRALGRLLSRQAHRVTPAGRWRAAAVAASGFRSLFNRPEAIGVLDQLRAGDIYWRAVLNYSAWGDLQAVLDEHLHHLAIAEGILDQLDDDRLLTLAMAVRGPLTLRPSPFRPFDPHHPHGRGILFNSRFALRYGTARQSDEAQRLPEIRSAFNSPFWPWVLATTSVGQEGIDFHWWCSSIIHWNIPANPVDFEQREGRVNRYGGLAIRRNLAERHRAAVLAARPRNAWDKLYELGLDERENLGELAPHWVYPGSSRIRRTVLPFPLSTDEARYRRLKDDLALYRLTFGQPRQEDLLEILKRRGVQHDEERARELRIDLSPPRVAAAAHGRGEWTA